MLFARLLPQAQSIGILISVNQSWSCTSFIIKLKSDSSRSALLNLLDWFYFFNCTAFGRSSRSLISDGRCPRMLWFALHATPVRLEALMMKLIHQQILSCNFVNHLTTGASAIPSWLRQALMSVARIGALRSTSCCWCSPSLLESQALSDRALRFSRRSCPFAYWYRILLWRYARPNYWQPSPPLRSGPCRTGLQGSHSRRLSWTRFLEHVYY